MLICNASISSSFFEDVKGIIFDVDGVLFDSWGANKAFYNAILDEMGLPPMTPEQETYVHAHAVKESYECIIPAERLDEVAEASRRVDYVKTALPHMTPENGLFEFLDFLKASKVRMGICTNRTNTMGVLTEMFGFDKWCWPIVSVGKVPPKPDPAGLNLIMREWALAPHEVAYIGDTSLDEQAAGAAGTRFWSFRSQKLEAELYIPDFPTLHQALQKCSFAN